MRDGGAARKGRKSAPNHIGGARKVEGLRGAAEITVQLSATMGVAGDSLANVVV